MGLVVPSNLQIAQEMRVLWAVLMVPHPDSCAETWLAITETHKDCTLEQWENWGRVDHWRREGELNLDIERPRGHQYHAGSNPRSFHLDIMDWNYSPANQV